MTTAAASSLRLLGKAAEVIGAGMYAVIFATFLLQIVARYVFHWPLGWPDELISTLFVWVVFWGAAFMVPYERQISFDLLHRTFPARAQKASDILSIGLTMALFLAAMPVTVDFIIFSHNQDTPVLDIPFSFVYVPVFLFLAATTVRMALEIRKVALRTSDAPDPS